MVDDDVVMYVATPEEPQGAHGSMVVRSGGWWIRRLPEFSDRAIEAVADGLRSRRIVSAALVRGELTDDRLWLAHEWHGALVVDRALGSRVLDQVVGWREDRQYDHPHVHVFRPDPHTAAEPAPSGLVETSAEYRDSLTSTRPVVIDLPCTEELARSSALFGEFADPRVGGSVALLMLSGATPGASRVRLRNPAALDLELVDDERSIGRLRKAGAIEVAAIGTSHSVGIGSAHARFADPEELDRLWERRSSSSYFVVLEASALVDPEVFVPLGQVFEQETVNRTQTLAAAAPGSAVVTPGRLSPMVLPAWCLNSELGAPDAEPVRATPLRARLSESDSQDAVWIRRRAVMSR
jgi:hypothetical protein